MAQEVQKEIGESTEITNYKEAEPRMRIKSWRKLEYKSQNSQN